MLDNLKSRLSTVYPNVESFVFAGFSAGGQLMNRYAYTSTESPDTKTRYVAGAPSSYLYLSPERPDGSGGFTTPTTICTTYNDYKYGLNNLTGTSYINAIGAANLTSNYGNNRVTYLVGSLDTDPNDTSMDLNCEAQLQGSQRVERMQNFLKYTDYFYGAYAGPIVERHKMEIVSGFAHSPSGVFGSSQGKAALLQGYTYSLPATLTQVRTSDSSTIASGGAVASNEGITIGAKSTIKDPISVGSTMYVELRKTSDRMTAPFNPSLTACASGTPWTECSSKVWKADATTDTTMANGIQSAATISGYDPNSDYYWETVMCDSNNICSDWTKFSGAGTSFHVNAIASVDVQVVDDLGAAVANPSFGFSQIYLQNECQRSTGQLGTTGQHIRVTSSLSSTAWTVNLAPTAGSGARWSSSDPSQSYYDMNDADDCTDGSDADTFGGRLSIDASTGTLAPQSGCSTAGIAQLGNASFSEGSTNQLTIINASANTQTNCYWDLTGITMNQSIPAAQPAGTYTLDMTISVVAQ